MARKLAPPITLGVITILAILFLTGTGTDNKDVLRDTFDVNAVYYDSGHVEVSYLDKSGNTESVVMEVLGMEESFQKTYASSNFIEIVSIEYVPKYGWKIHPVVFNISHKDFGEVQLKTEIYELDEQKPPIIYGQP